MPSKDRDRDIEVITIAGLISFLSVELMHSDGKRFIRVQKNKGGKYDFAIGHFNKTQGPTIVKSESFIYPTYHSALLAAIRCTKLGW